MNLRFLEKLLLDFVQDPNKSWGEPAEIIKGKSIRLQVEPGDRNSARIASGTYTPEQYADFNRQLGEVEMGHIRTAYFPGDPSNLPKHIPERVCQCGRVFRSERTEEDVECYECNLDRFCITGTDPGVKMHWLRDPWTLEAHSRVDPNRYMEFWWYNRNSGGNNCHQALQVYRDEQGAVSRLVFSSFVAQTRYCYRFEFNKGQSEVKMAQVKDVECIKSDDFTADNYSQFFNELWKLDPIVLDLLLAMLPSWMLYAHTPRESSY